MMLTGENMSAEEAHRLGFVSQIYPDTEALLAGVDSYGEKFARVSPTAVRLGRQTFQLLADMPAQQALDAAQFFNLPFFFGADLREGTSAFFEKRRPNWQEDEAT
jgi:enoyl-CoA hydratase/carnithine racemase